MILRYSIYNIIIYPYIILEDVKQDGGRDTMAWDKDEVINAAFEP
jgi:hypothetical protein